ncbi:MAG: PCMD domain-containing protein [Bacteroidales bacterium]|nr:PCMD domain-containing protein [Bacteroidales bacterium]
MRKYIPSSLFSTLLVGLSLSAGAQCESAKLIEEAGKFEDWRVCEIKESNIIGGNTYYIYKLSDGDTLRGNLPYIHAEDEPFATSNILANVSGITKASGSVFPDVHGDGRCARIEVILEKVKALGVINISAVSQGTIFVGSMTEPITSASASYSQACYGIPFTDRPKGLQFDYKADVGKRKTTNCKKYEDSPDYGEVVVFLQKRWEDEKGRIHAKRVGTAYMTLDESTDWREGVQLPISYGRLDSGHKYLNVRSELRPDGELALYDINSANKSTMIIEEGWADRNEQPTHLIMWFAASNSRPFLGGVGNKIWIDNVKFVY